MTPSLERLNEIVRQAEARSRAKKLGADAQQAAARLRESEAQARATEGRLREVRPAAIRRIEQADHDEHQLKELVKKLAQFKSTLDPESDAETLVDAARGEIDRNRREAKAALDEVGREIDESRKILRAAIEHYGQIRREIDRLQPEIAATFAADDRLAWEAETYFPGGSLLALGREVEAGVPCFGGLHRVEQYAQLKVWIGRYRQFQAEAGPDPSDETLALSQRIFQQLKSLSKQYEPGYIEAFRLDFHADWPAYVAEAQNQLQQATGSHAGPVHARP